MVEKKAETEKKLLLLLPILSGWIQIDRKLTDHQILALLRQFHGLMPIALDTGLNPMLEMVSRYKDHYIYGKDVEIILSPRGLKWLEEFHDRLRGLILHSH